MILNITLEHYHDILTSQYPKPSKHFEMLWKVVVERVLSFNVKNIMPFVCKKILAYMWKWPWTIVKNFCPLMTKKDWNEYWLLSHFFNTLPTVLLLGGTSASTWFVPSKIHFGLEKLYCHCIISWQRYKCILSLKKEFFCILFPIKLWLFINVVCSICYVSLLLCNCICCFEKYNAI